MLIIEFIKKHGWDYAEQLCINSNAIVDCGNGNYFHINDLRELVKLHKDSVKSLTEQINREREEATEWFVDFNHAVAEKRKLQDKINNVLMLLEPNDEISHRLYRKVYQILK